MSKRYQCVRQSDNSDCGAAALATVALHYQRTISLQRMRELAGTDRTGTNLVGLVEAAEKLGFSARAVEGPYEALTGATLPAIAHVVTAEGLGHFVVLHRVKKDAVVIADPARGVVQLTADEFREMWTGYLLILAPDERQVNADHLADAPRPSRRFLALLRPHAPLLMEALFCALIMTGLGLSTSYFIQHLVDGVLTRHDKKLLNALGIGMVLIMVFQILFAILRQYLLAHIGRKVDLSLTASYARHILGLPMRFFEMRRVGEILSRVGDAEKVTEAVRGTATTTLVDGILVTFFMTVLWLYDLPLAMLATVFLPLLVASVLVHVPTTKRLSLKAMEAAAQHAAHFVEDVSGVETIKAYGIERSRSEQGEDRLVKVVQHGFSLEKIGMSLTSLGTFVTGIAGIAILWYGGHRVMSGALTIGQLMFFNSLLGYLLDPLGRLATVNVTFQDALVAVDRLYQVLDMETEQLGDEHKLNFPGLAKGIDLQDVSFRYGCRANVLEKVTMHIPAGRKVAIVGESGSGKSTFLKLLMGFYAPTGGRVLLDGVDMQNFRLSSIRSRIGLVSQEPFIFTGSIKNNIVLGRPNASLEEVMEAARDAGLAEFIENLPERYDTLIGERGANLSGGQRQRLAIARALLRRPDILIFDEATSHLDSRTEQAIQESLRSVFADRTVLLVAHRLSTVRDADLIYVMHEGRVVEQGSHLELFAQGGRYAELWRSQGAEPTVTAEFHPHNRINGHQTQLAAV